ncbi:MAG: hypothetical protein JZU53_01700 [Paludibacter sp.]|nr:hypothetical protein [Paludibacter sp.]
MNNNINQTEITYNLNELVSSYYNKFSSYALIFNGREYTLRKFLSVVLILSPISIFLFNLNKIDTKTFSVYFFVFILSIIIAAVFSFFVIINPYPKKKVQILLKDKEKHGFNAFFSLWPIDDFRNYQKLELVKWFREKGITELPQYELLSTTIDCKIKSKKPFFIIKFGVLFSLLMAIWLQINQHLIETIDDFYFLLKWGLSITVFVVCLWYFLNQILIGHDEIINIENRQREQFNNLLNEIIFDMKMKKYSTDTFVQ